MIVIELPADNILQYDMGKEFASVMTQQEAETFITMMLSGVRATDTARKDASKDYDFAWSAAEVADHMRDFWQIVTHVSIFHHIAI